jgi:hypothetical protein
MMSQKCLHETRERPQRYSTLANSTVLMLKHGLQPAGDGRNGNVPSIEQNDASRHARKNADYLKK